jgi:hypothetical protein
MAENTLYGSSQNQPVIEETTDIQKTAPGIETEQVTTVEKPVEAPVETPKQENTNIKDLYKTLIKTKDETGTPYYTASFDEFKNTYSNKKNIDFLYKGMKEDNLTSEDDLTFYNKYFPDVPAKMEEKSAQEKATPNEEEQTPSDKINKVQNIDSEDPPSKKLWEKLRNLKTPEGESYFSGDYKKFKTMFSDKESIAQLFTTIQQSGLLESLEDHPIDEKLFYNNYFPDFKKKVYGKVIIGDSPQKQPLSQEELSKIPPPTSPSESQLKSSSEEVPAYDDVLNLIYKKNKAVNNIGYGALVEGVIKTPLYGVISALAPLDKRFLEGEKALKPDYSGIKSGWNDFSSITQELKSRGYSDQDIAALTQEVAGFQFDADEKTLNTLSLYRASNPAGYQAIISNLNARANVDEKTRGLLRDAFNRNIGVIGGTPGNRYEVLADPISKSWKQRELFSPPASDEDKYNDLDKLNRYIRESNQIIDQSPDITPEDKEKYKQQILSGASSYAYLNIDSHFAKEYLSKNMNGEMELKVPDRVQTDVDIVTNNPIYSDVKEKDFSTDPNLDKYSVRSIRENLNPANPVDNAVFDVYVKRIAVNDAFEKVQREGTQHTWSQDKNNTVAEAAVNYYVSINPDVARDYDAAHGNLDDKYVGSLVDKFIHDPYVYDNSAYKFSIDQARKNFAKDFPEYNQSVVANKLAQYAEDNGYNDGIVNAVVNIPTQARMDEIADKMIASGQLTKDEYNIYKDKIRDDLDFLSYAGRTITSTLGMQKLNPNPIETSDFVGKFAEGYSGVIQSGARTLEQEMTHSLPGMVLNQAGYWPKGWSDDANVARILDEGVVPKLNPTATHAVFGAAGQFTGFVVGMGMMGTALKGIGFSPAIAHDVSAFQTFWGNNYYQAKKDHPKGTIEDNALAFGQAISNTGIDVVFLKMLPSNKAVKAFQKELKGDYAELLKKVSTGAITGEVASKTILDKALNFFATTAASSVKSGAILSTMEALHEINNNLFTGKSVDMSEIASKAMKDLIPNTLSSVVVSAFGARGQIKEKEKDQNTKITFQNTWDMASRPGLYEYHIDQMEKQGVDKNIINDYRTNLQTIVDAKKSMDEDEFSNLSEEQKQKFVGLSLMESVYNKKAVDAQDPAVAKKLADNANAIRLMKERVLDSKDKAEELKKTDATEESTIIDEKKAGEEIPDILEKVKNFKNQIDQAKKTLESDPNNAKAKEDLDFYEREFTLFNQDPVKYTEDQNQKVKESLDEELKKGTSKEDLSYDRVLANNEELLKQSKLYGEKYQSGISGILGKGEGTEQTQSQQATGGEAPSTGGVLQTQGEAGGIEKSSPEAQEKIGSPEKTMAALQGLPEDQSAVTINVNGEELPIKGNEEKIAQAYHEGADENLKNKVDEIFGIRTEAAGAVLPEAQVPEGQKIPTGLPGGIDQAGGVTATGAAAVSGGGVGRKVGATIPFEITTYIEGQHKQEYDAAIKKMVDKGESPESASTKVNAIVAEELRDQLPKILESEGIKAELIDISEDKGGYTNSDNNEYSLTDNIIIKTAEGTSEADVNSILNTVNVGADQQAANAFMEATPEEMASENPDVHGVFFFEKPSNMSEQDFSKMMVELNGIKGTDGKSFLTGHTPFGKNVIGIGGHFYGKEFGKSVKDNQAKINEILTKYGVDLSQSQLTNKKVLTYDRSRNTQQLSEGTGNKSGFSEKDQRLIQKSRNLYSDILKKIASGERTETKLKSESKQGAESGKEPGKENVTGQPPAEGTQYQAGKKAPSSIPEQVFTPIVKRITKTIQKLFGKPDNKVIVLTGKDWQDALQRAMNGEDVNFQAFGGFEKKGFEETEEYQKLKAENKIVENFDIRNLAGKSVIVINPDNMITGVIIDKNGKTIINGNGGINFVSKFGDVWASSDFETADQLAKYINKAVKNDIANGGDGKVHIVVTKGSLSKSLTSHTGAKGAMSVLESMVDNGLISLSNFRKSLTSAGKKYGIDFNGKSDAKSIHKDIADKFFGLSDSSFEERGTFIKDVIDELSANMNAELNKAKEELNNTKKGTQEYKDSKKKVDDIKKAIDENKEKIREYLNSNELGRKIDFKSEGLIDAMGLLFSDNITVGVPGSSAYATIEVSGEVEVKKTEKEEGGHESYPFHIKQKNGDRPVLNILSSNDHITDIANDKNNKSVPKQIPAIDKNGNPVLKKDGTPKMQSGANKLGSNQVGMSEAIIKPESDLPQKNKAQFMSDSKGEVYGIEQNGNIILNGDKMNANTAVHEPAHVWISWAEQNRPDLHEAGLDKVKGSQYLEDVKNDPFYQEQASKLPEDQRELYYQKEALAKAIGDQGEKFVTNAQKASFKSWIFALWKSVIKQFGIQNMSAEDVSKMTLDEFSQKVAAHIFEGREGEAGTAKSEAPAQKQTFFSAEGEGKGEKKEEKPKEEATGISKEELEKKYNFTKTFDSRGDQQVADDAMNNLSESAKKNKVSLDEQAENDVALMKYKKGSVTEQDIITAAYHLKSLDAQIEAKNNAGEDASYLLAKREAALETLRMLGNNAGRNLRLFSVAYRNVEEGKLEATRAQLKKSLNLPDVPKTIKELDASKMSEVDKAKVRPYVEAIEKLNKDLKDIDAKAETEIKNINEAELKEYIDKEIKRRIESGEIKVTVSKRDKTLAQKGEAFANKIQKLKIDIKKLGDGGIQSNIAGVPIFFINKFVDLVAASVRGGATLAEAISMVINDPKNADEKYKLTEKQLEDYLINSIDISDRKDDAIGKMKEIAQKDKISTLTPEMVDANLVNHVVNSIIHSQTPYDKVVSEATKELKEVLPDVTEEDVSDALLRKGKFKKQSKKAAIQEIEDKKKDVKRLIIAKNKLSALEAGVNAGAPAMDNSLSAKEKKAEIQKRKSDYEKEVDNKLKEINEKKKEAAAKIKEAEAEAKKAEAELKKEKERKAELEEKLRKVKAGEEIESKKKGEPKKESDEIEDLKKQIEQAKKDRREKESELKKQQERKADLEEKLRKIKADEEIETKKKNEPKKESDEIEDLKKQIDQAKKDKKEEKRIKELQDKLNLLQSGQKPAPAEKGEAKVESPAVEELKAKIKETDENLRKKEAELKRIKELQDKLDLLESGQRPAPKAKGAAKVESAEVEELKRKIKEADEKLRAKEKEFNAAQAKQKRFNDKVADLNQQIDFVNQNKTVFQKALNDPKKANEEVKALNDELKAAYNQAGIRLESGSKNEIKIAQDAEAEINAIKQSDLPEDVKQRDIKDVEKRRDEQIRNTKQGVLVNLKTNIDSYIDVFNSQLNEAIANGDTEAQKEISGVLTQLQGLSDLSGKLSPNIENLKDQIDKADQKLSELIEKTEGTELQNDIRDIQDKFREDWQVTSDEMQRNSLISKAERDLKEAQRRMNAGQYTEIPTQKFDAKRDDVVSRKQAEAQKAWKQLNGMAMKAKEKQQQQGIVSKWLKLRRDFMIMSFGAIEKVAGSSITKPIIDPFIKQTFGRVSNLITGIRPTSLKKMGMTYGQEFKNQESANKFITITNDEYISALDKYENDVKQFGEDSKEALSSKEKLDNAELQKEFATAYLFINANSAVDIAQVMVNGATDFDAKMGKSRQSFASERTKLEGMWHWIESMNRTHGAMKSVSHRQALLDEYMENLQYIQDKDGSISMDRRQQAWDLAVLRSEAGRFGEETMLSKGIGQLKGSESTAKRNMANYLLPVAKIGINITKQGVDMAFPGFELLGKAMTDGNIKRGMKLNEQDGKVYNNAVSTFYNGIKRGYEELPLQQKKYINTLITRGLFGLAQYATVGYLLSSGMMKYGGSYNPYDRKKKLGSDGKPLEHGEWEIGGVRMPEIFNMVFNHSPYALPTSIAASGYQNAKEGEYYKMITGTVNEVYERLPFQSGIDLIGAVTGDKFKLEKAIGAEVPVPAFSKNIAEAMDKDEEGNVRPVKIYTDDIWETVTNMAKSKIPGLRSTLETKPELYTDKQAEQYPNIVKLQAAGIMLPDIGSKKFEVERDSKHPDGKLSESEMKAFLSKLRENYNDQVGATLNTNWKLTNQKTGEIVYSLGEGLAKFKGDKERATSELQEMSVQDFNKALDKTYKDFGLKKATTTLYKVEKAGTPLFTKEDISSSKDLSELVSKGFELPSVPSIGEINADKDVAIPLTNEEYETFKQIMKKEINNKLKLMFTSAYRYEEFSPELQRQMYGNVQIGGQLMNIKTEKEDGTKSNLFQDKFDESISGIKNEILKKMGKLKPKKQWTKAN